MNVLLIAQCDKRALTESRRILDQFAERRGSRTWQTPITRDGLDTLRRLLRKTARKNTAVACHWIRGIDHSELIWVVGDRRRFNAQGAVPTNTSERDVRRQDDESDWRSAGLIRLLADLAGLFHDLGKATQAFQDRLQGNLLERNLVRHEWASLRLFEAFVGDDDDIAWLTRLADPSESDDARWLGALRRDGIDSALPSPLASLSRAPIAQALAWLVLSHHRLPTLPKHEVFQMSSLEGLLSQLTPQWNEDAFADATPQSLETYWRFASGLPTTTNAWRHRAARNARRLLAELHADRTAPALSSPLDDPFVMHLGRLCLMLSDHHYSSLEGIDNAARVRVDSSGTLLANTRRGDRKPNQLLDEHLIGVARDSAEIARYLPTLRKSLPHLGRHQQLTRRARDDRFRWQDRASDMSASMRARSALQGAFIVNMASTGSGKTLANARIMNGLADEKSGMRCTFALGLRTLTLQTGKAFEQLLQLGDDELAIRVGGSASRALFEYHESQSSNRGSASLQDLVEEDAHVVFEGHVSDHPVLRKFGKDGNARAMLEAPLLVCTIDHLTPATESQRGGRQIVPMLRLLTGDLVLDEPDDFDLSDLPALTRLVHWAGLLGSRVLIASATLPPSLVLGLFEAYRNGRQHFARNCGEIAIEGPTTSTTSAICCAWVDEFEQESQDCADADAFSRGHERFASRRNASLLKLAREPRRRGALLPTPVVPLSTGKNLTALAELFAPEVLDAAVLLHHQHHARDPRTGKRVSFGLVRFANVEPLVEIALALFRRGAPPNTRIHLCVYHSRHPAIIRSAIESQLDSVLQRHDPATVFTNAHVRRQLDGAEEPDQIFLVLGSPVTEVGRDHDYDWAVVEPSSMRSLIQLAGRVRRHRYDAVDTPNILVFSHNLRHFGHPGGAAFRMPGFESDEAAFRLESHDLNLLLEPEELAIIDARPRISARAVLAPRNRLVDLEHARLRETMLRLQASAASERIGSRARALNTFVPPGQRLNATTWWNQAPRDALLTAVLPQQQRFRKEQPPFDETLVLLPDDDDRAILHEVKNGDQRGERNYVRVDVSRCTHVPDSSVHGPRIAPWGATDYMGALRDLATALDMPLGRCAERFGTVTVRPSENGWRYHPALGFSRQR
ncbi:type I-F CRISPR-associated helicase Cas3f [Gemmatimonas sp.]|uniref:type I-F CRISPR-associated helicase Cas3f n=1 Tax=Gemmatimonas sp. TaxID=1962908 RepID=UPI00286E5ABC|nr:type I-F CRISPR-associated helicase Cas3f [Gemmatimonas sp.]